MAVTLDRPARGSQPNNCFVYTYNLDPNVDFDRFIEPSYELQVTSPAHKKEVSCSTDKTDKEKKTLVRSCFFFPYRCVVSCLCRLYWLP